MNLITELIKAFTPQADGFLFMWVLAALALMAAVLIVDRWLELAKRTNVDSTRLIEKVKQLVEEKRHEEAYQLCVSGGKRALPRILGAGVHKAMQTPQMIRSAMEEESLHVIPLLERRVSLILMFGNVSTLLGLMGTIYGLILSFAAVARSDVAAATKSSLLASGISTAMNTTLMGLMISVPCILIYSVLRSRIDQVVQEIDRHGASLLKSLLPQDIIQRDYKVSGKRIKAEEDTEPNIAPMMNLMVILIPLLLTSAEFVKIGAIELKLPSASQGDGDGGAAQEEKKDIKLDLGVGITAKGFNLHHYFEKDGEEEQASAQDEEQGETPPDVPKVDGEYDYEALNAALADVKRQALLEMVRSIHPSVPENASLIKLFTAYKKREDQFAGSGVFEDHESIKIVAEGKIKYQVVVSVMDAARGVRMQAGKVTMFPNVSLGAGIVY